MSFPRWLSRTLEPLAGLVWPVFLFWSGIVTVLWLSRFSPEEASPHISNSGLREAALLLLNSANAIWIVLAAANVYAALIQQSGIASARRQTLLICAVAAGVAVCSVRTGQPLGPMFFTKQLGAKLGPVPLGWPLLCFVTIVGAREVAMRWLPRSSYAAIAIVAGVLALATAVNLELVSEILRFFWFRFGPDHRASVSAPWTSYALWFAAGAAAAFLPRGSKVFDPAARPNSRSIIVFCILNLLCVTANLFSIVR